MGRMVTKLAHFLARRRLRGCDAVGARPVAVGAPRVENRGTIRIGARFRCDSSAAPVELVARAGGELVVGHRVTIDGGAVLCATVRVEVGDGVHVGPWCVVADSALWQNGDGGAVPEASPIRIEAGVRLGERVVVLPGAVVGAGTFVAPGSVVDGVLPPRVVAAGVPARAVSQVRVRRGDGVGREPFEAPADHGTGVHP